MIVFSFNCVARVIEFVLLLQTIIALVLTPGERVLSGGLSMLDIISQVMTSTTIILLVHRKAGLVGLNRWLFCGIPITGSNGETGSGQTRSNTNTTTQQSHSSAATMSTRDAPNSSSVSS